MATNKIMFFDIDGTILSETTHTIPKSTVEGLQKAKEQGHLILLIQADLFHQLMSVSRN